MKKHNNSINLKNKIMKSMDFTKASVEKAVEAIKKHGEELDAIRKEGANLSIEEIAQKLIIDKFGDAQIEAEEIVNDLKKGLANFDAQFNKNKSTETINVKECLEEATKDNTEEERKNCYVNILTAIELLNAKELSEDDVNAKLAENAELSEEELLAKIEDVMNSTISLDSLAEKVKEGLNSDTLSQLAKEIELNKDDYRFMAAVWLYVEQREGNLKLSDSDFAISAEQIGTLAGASVEAIITNNALNEGKIDMATWQKVMKWIIGAAIGLFLAYGCFLVVANVSLLAMSLILSILGTGTFALFLSLAVAIYVAWKSSDIVGEAWMMAMEAYLDFYNKHIAGITAKVASWITALKTWFANAVDKAKSVVSGNKNQAETQQTETNNEEQNLQGQPVMA